MPSSDLSAARPWIRVAEDFQHPGILLAYGTSIRLLTQYLVILKNLTSSLAVLDAFSACLRKHTPARAVELLEQRRDVFGVSLLG